MVRFFHTVCVYPALFGLQQRENAYIDRFIHNSITLTICLNEEKVIVTNFSSENNLPMFRLNAPVVIRVKVKRCKQTLLFIAMHY